MARRSLKGHPAVRVVGEDARVVLGFPPGTGPMPHPPCAAFITEKIRFLIPGWVTCKLIVFFF